VESDIQGSVLSVQGRNTRNGSTIYDIAFSDGNTYTTFDPDLATKANNLAGQAVSARVKVEQKGRFTNFYLNDIAPAGQLAPQALPAPGGTAVGVPVAGGIPIVSNGGGSGGGRGGMTPEREAKIVKQNVLGTAFGFVGALFQGAGPEALEEATSLAGALAQKLYGVVQGAQPQAAVPVAAPVATTPQEVAAEVAAEAGEGVVSVGVGAEEETLPWL
jgi:hypothetical protein